MAQYNEFVVRFGNVNGSGSASSNLMFAKSLFRLGLDVAAKNIFPSNIQGAPTAYEIRASEAGYSARREGVDLMICMNPQTYATDLSLVSEGGLLMYDNTLERDFVRPGVEIFGVPFTRLCLDAFGDIKQRFLFKNLVINGVLCGLLDIDKQVFVSLIEEQFASKPKLVEPNLRAFHLGNDWYNNFDEKPSCAVKARPVANPVEKIMITGNEASGLGCVYGGATVAAWYPITPSTSLAEGFQKYTNMFRQDDEKGNRVAIVQAEDELSAAGIVIGAGWNGARSFTATSGPGISLMSEFIGLAYFAEVPVVFFNIQRGGPSTGMPTRTQQSDILSTAYASHGDTKHPMLFPASPKECFEMAVAAFDLADRLQTPIFVMSDLDLGMNDWVCEPFEWDDSRTWDRGKIVSAKQLDEWSQYGRYLDVDGDGICYRSLPGTHSEKGAYLSRGTSHDEFGGYTEDGTIHARILDRILVKWETTKTLVPKPVYGQEGIGSDVAVLSFGTSSLAMEEARDILAEKGYKVDLVRLLSFPFDDEMLAWLRQHKKIFILEQNRDAQMRRLLAAEADLAWSTTRSILCFDGMPPTAAGILKELEPHLEAQKGERKSA